VGDFGGVVMIGGVLVWVWLTLLRGVHEHVIVGVWVLYTSVPLSHSQSHTLTLSLSHKHPPHADDWHADLSHTNKHEHTPNQKKRGRSAWKSSPTAPPAGRSYSCPGTPGLSTPPCLGGRGQGHHPSRSRSSRRRSGPRRCCHRQRRRWGGAREWGGQEGSGDFLAWWGGGSCVYRSGLCTCVLV
jgi:hypothetical protein